MLGEQLAREEARAGRRELFVRPDGSGGARLSGHLDPEGAAILDAALQPLARPRPADGDGPDPRTMPQRHADALVTLSLDALRTGLGAALLPTGDVVSAAAARRWACDARIIPAVLDGESVPLDVGRARRLCIPAQRRDACAFPGCDRPGSWCDAHHLRHWVGGGPPDLSNGVLLCGHHHQVVPAANGRW